MRTFYSREFDFLQTNIAQAMVSNVRLILYINNNLGIILNVNFPQNSRCHRVETLRSLLGAVTAHSFYGTTK